MTKTGILIIGGGVVGASTAYHLSKRGAENVLILERETAQGFGSTGRATGGIRQQFGTEINIKMSQYSTDFLRNCEFETGYEPRGYLFFATDENQLNYLQTNVKLQKSLGVNDVEIVDKQTISEMIRGMNCEDIVGGSFCRSDGFINPIALMKGFTQNAAGVKIETASEVLSIETKSEKVVAVNTNNGRIEAEKVVICSGAWAKTLAKSCGIDLPVEPLRRQIVWAKASEKLPKNLPMVIDIGTGFHFRPAADFINPNETDDSHIFFAYPDRDEKVGFDTSFDETFIPKVVEKARHRAKFLGEAHIIREKCRAGLYEVSPDHHAILGGCEVEGLYFACGFSGHGVMHSPATGRALSEIILDGKSSFLDISSLSLERFAKGELLIENAYI
jgi:sarcosine oxidase, subunit beta